MYLRPLLCLALLGCAAPPAPTARPGPPLPEASDVSYEAALDLFHRFEYRAALACLEAVLAEEPAERRALGLRARLQVILGMREPGFVVWKPGPQRHETAEQQAERLWRQAQEATSPWARRKALEEIVELQRWSPYRVDRLQELAAAAAAALAGGAPEEAFGEE